ncbi:MAG: DUF3224 domain-containing protein [SAR202 cluster bacterium]|nr:DUF3224 domain-containing protein [SAR202 cluster bacterium]MDP6513402.1 DUF3224 domain-containing protein [SAR202 cluster bacterium]MDP6714621.1 DUF3224 domain-containing protein [SAR202 cluster bacterium]
MRTIKLSKSRFVILMSLVALMTLAAVAVVQASTPIPTEGTFVSTVIPGTFSVDKVVGQNMFYSVDTIIVLEGNLEGTGLLEETGVEHGGGAGPLIAHGVIHFEGTIDGHEGSIDIQYNRIKHGGLSSPAQWEGDRMFVTNTGTGELANLHGGAHIVGVYGVGSSTGQYHFD